MTYCSSKALIRDFAYAYKFYTAQSEIEQHMSMFYEADVRQ